MSMSIDGSIKNLASSRAPQGAKEFAVKPEKSDANRPQFNEKLQTLMKTGVEVSAQRRREQLENMAGRLTTRAVAVAARFEEIGVRWDERLGDLEANALESGDPVRAERIADIGEKVTKRLNDVSEEIVSRLDKLSERIGNMLSESYGAIGDDLPNRENSEVDDVA